MDLSPGTVLLGKYRIDEVIGTGGMGHVVRASHLYLHQPVAIKVLLPEMAQSDSTKQRFLREAQATVKLRSEHTTRVMDVGSTPDGVPFMVMEFLEGNDLNQILRHHGPQMPAIAVDLMLQACEGIAEAHALGIIHRDVKPSNFFITRRPDGSMLLKILDFGISKTPVDYGELTGTQTVIGTPSYMAPEQMKSGRSADPRSDIWSIGVVVYQLISGRLPFSGESYADLVLKVGLEPPAPILVPLPSGLGEVILRCMEKDPRARHQHVGELARMLAPYASDPIAAAQSAGRTMRILQQRGAQQMGQLGQLGMQTSPFAAGGGLSTPVPISPAQLTPRSWPPSQGTSLSHGAGQMTLKTRGNRGLLVAGVLTLCVLAGAGGYAASQLTKRGAAAPTEPHVLAPAPTLPAAEPANRAGAPTATGTAPSANAAGAAPSANAAGAQTGTAPAGTASTGTAPSGTAQTGTAPAGTASTGAAPSGTAPTDTAATGTAATGTADTNQPPSTWKPSTPAPTIVDPAHPAGPNAATATADAKSADPRAAGATSADAKSADVKSASARPADSRATGATSADVRTASPKSADATSAGATSADARSASPKPADAKAAGAKSTDARSIDGSKPAGAKSTDARSIDSAKPAGAKASTASKSADSKTTKTTPPASKTGVKPADSDKPAKPTKPRTDDLFDSRH